MSIFGRLLDMLRNCLPGKLFRPTAPNPNLQALVDCFNEALKDPLIQKIASESQGVIGEKETTDVLYGLVSGYGDVTTFGEGARPHVIASLILLLGVVLRDRIGLMGGKGERLFLLHDDRKRVFPWLRANVVSTVPFIGEELKLLKLHRTPKPSDTLDLRVMEVDAIVACTDIFMSPAGSPSRGRSTDPWARLADRVAMLMRSHPCVYTIGIALEDVRRIRVASWAKSRKARKT